MKSLEKYQYWNDPDGKLSSGSFHLQNCGNSQVRVRPTALTNGDVDVSENFAPHFAPSLAFVRLVRNSK